MGQVKGDRIKTSNVFEALQEITDPGHRRGVGEERDPEENDSSLGAGLFTKERGYGKGKPSKSRGMQGSVSAVALGKKVNKFQESRRAIREFPKYQNIRFPKRNKKGDSF